MRTRWLAIAATGLALLGSPAMAATEIKHDWYLLNFGAGVCEKGSKEHHADTPDNFHKSIRAEGLIDAVRVDKDADGNVKAVYITYRELLSRDTVFAFFVDKETCEIGRKWFADQGWIAGNPEDLK